MRAPALEASRIVPWTAQAVEAVVQAHPDRYRAVPVLAAGCGLRQGETFGVRVEDVEFLRQRVLVRQQVKLVAGRPTLAAPKGGKTREVPLPEVVAVELSEHLRRYPPVDGLDYTTREGGPIDRTYYNPGIWKPALRAAGIAPTRENGMHALRHWYASVQLEAGTSIRALAEYLGHADPGFTLRVYTHLMPSSEDRARSRSTLRSVLLCHPRVTKRPTEHILPAQPPSTVRCRSRGGTRRGAGAGGWRRSR